MRTSVTDTLRTWVVGLFIRAISSVSREEDRRDALNWLARSRDIVASDSDSKTKYVALYKNVNTSKAIGAVFNSVAASIRNYKNSNLPMAVKIALPVTLLAAPFAGGQGAGIAAFGSAIGVPVLLLMFLGTTGIASIIEACARNVDARTHVQTAWKEILRAETLRQMRADIRNGKQGKPKKPMRVVVPSDEIALREHLLGMKPDAFESHVMSYFDVPALRGARMTKRSGDDGVDGFAIHERGLIVVQCKRNAVENLVTGPAIRDFLGTMEIHKAWRGYFVTTSGFTRQASDYLDRFDKIVRVDMDKLVDWHREPPLFSE